MVNAIDRPQGDQAADQPAQHAATAIHARRLLGAVATTVAAEPVAAAAMTYGLTSSRPAVSAKPAEGSERPTDASTPSSASGRTRTGI
jgi:hypothetical protein